MADSGEPTNKGLYLSLNNWAGFAFLFHSQACSLGLAWMLDQALCNPADVRVKAGTNATKWRRKNVNADAKEEGQLKLYGMLTRACGAAIKNMALLMKDEVAATDAASAALISIEDAPATCLWSALMRKFLCS